MSTAVEPYVFSAEFSGALLIVYHRTNTQQTPAVAAAAAGGDDGRDGGRGGGRGDRGRGGRGGRGGWRGSGVRKAQAQKVCSHCGRRGHAIHQCRSGGKDALRALGQQNAPSFGINLVSH